MSVIAERLKEGLLLAKMTQSELAVATGIGKSSISTYLSGAYEPKQKNVYKMARALGVSEAWLMGYEESDASRTMGGIPENIQPIILKRFPILGEIACGEPIFAREDHESYIMASGDIKADFCLVAKGDSMVGARINDGDVVFIKEQPSVDNGEIAAVIIGEEATLKRWFFYPEKKKLLLSPANDRYEPLIYEGAELGEVRCLGKAVCFMSKL